MGIRTVAVFSDADRNSPFVEQADIAVYLGESEPVKSYLNQDNIVEISLQQKVDAIHPGFGFLAENAQFAQKCIDAGIIFIGPSPDAIASMGSKSAAKRIMQKAGVPCVPGYQGKVQTIKRLEEEALKVGFPLLLKATAGGGGKGMRIVRKKSELKEAIKSAKSEAKNAFDNDELIIEKYIESGRHIEFQIIGDEHGNLIHLLERECSIQRRYQKIIEESPSPVLTNKLRNEMGDIAVKAGKAINYSNAGTVEFILAENNGKFDYYFLEMNTRLQVEHPVTEEITGLDLVQLQIEVAEGRKLKLKQKDIRGCGYAIECRLYAEDAENDFMPSTGKILKWEIPESEGLRVETDICSGGEVSIYYDPMIAKVITYGTDRAIAHRKMEYALKHLQCVGITTNQDFLVYLMQHKAFQEGDYDTHFIKEKCDYTSERKHTENNLAITSIMATLLDWQERENKRKLLKSLSSGWRNNFYQNQFQNYLFKEKNLSVQYKYNEGGFIFQIEEQNYEVKRLSISNNKISLEVNGVFYQSTIIKELNKYYIYTPELGNYILEAIERFPDNESEKVKGGYIAPMPSQILRILVEVEQEVKEGEPLIVITSMKMENTIYADEAGVVKEIFVTEGENVEAGFQLLLMDS